MAPKKKTAKLASLAAPDAENAVIKDENIQHYISESSYAISID